MRHRAIHYLNNRLEQDHRGLKGDTDRCAASNVPDPRPGSAEGTMNAEMSFVPVPVITSMFPQTAAECSSSAGLRPCSPYWKPLDRPYAKPRASAIFAGARPDGTQAITRAPPVFATEPSAAFNLVDRDRASKPL